MHAYPLTVIFTRPWYTNCFVEMFQRSNEKLLQTSSHNLSAQFAIVVYYTVMSLFSRYSIVLKLLVTKLIQTNEAL
jgi:hypothetical protein